MTIPANWSRCRIVGYLVDDDNEPYPSSWTLRFVSTASRLQDPVSHRLVLPEQDLAVFPGSDGFFYVDRLSDTDTDLTSGGSPRQTKVTLLNGATEVQSWWVTVDHAAASNMNFNVDGTIATSGGSALPAVWLTALEDFSSAPVTGSPTIAAHVAQPDPHPQYVLTTELGKQLAKRPEDLWSGTVTRNGGGAATGASVVWPDGATGTYASTATDGTNTRLVNGWTVTHVANAVTTTYTQPTITRNAAGDVTARPAIVVS